MADNKFCCEGQAIQVPESFRAHVQAIKTVRGIIDLHPQRIDVTDLVDVDLVTGVVRTELVTITALKDRRPDLDLQPEDIPTVELNYLFSYTNTSQPLSRGEWLLCLQKHFVRKPTRGPGRRKKGKHG